MHKYTPIYITAYRRTGDKTQEQKKTKKNPEIQGREHS